MVIAINNMAKEFEQNNQSTVRILKEHFIVSYRIESYYIINF